MQYYDLAHHGVIVWPTHFAGEVSVAQGRVLAGEFLLFGIPGEAMAGAEGNRAEVTHGGGTMTSFDVANWQCPRAYAVEEIPHVILTLVEPEGIRGQGCL